LCECIFPYEQRILIPSRKVKTYDETPKMEVEAITANLLKNIKHFDFFVVNFANGDMVGHTGNLRATIKGVEAVDKAIGEIVSHFEGLIFITADHGNCEDMLDDCSTCHTTAKVPLIFVGGNDELKEGGLADVAPTILSVMNLKKPKEMTGRSLIENRF